MKDNKKIQLRINGAEFFIFKFYILLMSIMTIITVTIIANNFTIICSPCSSLTGVIRFLIIVYIDNKLRTEKFPSLTGVIHFLIYPLKPAWLLGSKRVLRGKIIFDWKPLIYIFRTSQKRRFYPAFRLCG